MCAFNSSSFFVFAFYSYRCIFRDVTFLTFRVPSLHSALVDVYRQHDNASRRAKQRVLKWRKRMFPPRVEYILFRDTHEISRSICSWKTRSAFFSKARIYSIMHSETQQTCPNSGSLSRGGVFYVYMHIRHVCLDRICWRVYQKRSNPNLRVS